MGHGPALGCLCGFHRVYAWDVQRWCEIYADTAGRLVVRFFELVRGAPVMYGDYVSVVPIPSEVETAYAARGPFGDGPIERLRVVS